MFHRIKQLTLVLGDLLALNLSLCAALWLRYFSWPADQWAELFYPMAGLFAAAIVIFFIVGLYDIGQAKKNLYRFRHLAGVRPDILLSKRENCRPTQNYYRALRPRRSNFDFCLARSAQ